MAYRSLREFMATLEAQAAGLAVVAVTGTLAVGAPTADAHRRRAP